MLPSINRKGRFAIGNVLLTFTVFALILASSPMYFSGSGTNLVQPVFGQPEDPFPQVSNETLTPAQREAREKLLQEQGFSVKVIARNLSAPLNLLYGPDNALWITERIGKDIVRVDPNNGTKLSAMPIPNVNQSKGQDGVLGMAFDPDFNNTHYVYVAYTYVGNSSQGIPELKTKITRFTYEQNADKISEPMDLISGLSGSGDHNSGRMTFGPDGKLYYTIGDQGKNQLALFCSDNRAQQLPTTDEISSKNWTAYEGKVLRMNSDGSIPDDNPEIEGVKSHVYTFVHINEQGLAVVSIGVIYVAKQGEN